MSGGTRPSSLQGSEELWLCPPPASLELSPLARLLDPLRPACSELPGCMLRAWAAAPVGDPEAPLSDPVPLDQRSLLCRVTVLLIQPNTSWGPGPHTSGEGCR